MLITKQRTFFYILILISRYALPVCHMLAFSRPMQTLSEIESAVDSQ
jgi:hypothetical protein